MRLQPLPPASRTIAAAASKVSIGCTNISRATNATGNRVRYRSIASSNAWNWLARTIV